MNERYSTTKQVAAFFQVTPRTVATWMKEGIIPYYKVGRSVRFDLDAVKLHLDKNYKIFNNDDKIIKS